MVSDGYYIDIEHEQDTQEKGKVNCGNMVSA
jgi:hypothetical protein